MSTLTMLDINEIQNVRLFVAALEAAGFWSRDDLAAWCGLDRPRLDAVLAHREPLDAEGQIAVVAFLSLLQDNFTKPEGRAAQSRLNRALTEARLNEMERQP